MKTEKIRLGSLRNEEHFQFHNAFEELASQFDLNVLGISDLVKSHGIQLMKEKNVLQVIDKSALSQKLVEYDKVRDHLFRGFADGVKSCLNHYDPKVREAANNVFIVLHEFGNIAKKPYNQETAALNLLVGELKSKHKKDITTMKMEEWLPHLSKANDDFDEILNSRYSEEASKVKLQMTDVRSQIDRILRDICDKLDALMLINGVKQYNSFVLEYNERVELFTNSLQIRRGRASKKNDDTDDGDDDIPSYFD